MSEFFWFIW